VFIARILRRNSAPHQDEDVIRPIALYYQSVAWHDRVQSLAREIFPQKAFALRRLAIAPELNLLVGNYGTALFVAFIFKALVELISPSLFVLVTRKLPHRAECPADSG